VSVFLDPTKAPTERSIRGVKQLAPRRFTNLDGVRLGLVSNSKLNADNVLLAIGDLLAERYDLETIIHERKGNFSLPAPDEVVDKIVRGADVVIAGVGD
jgi:hypothetical protein